MTEQFSDRYVVIQELERGGFSRTYLALDLHRPDYPLCVIKALTIEADCPSDRQRAQWMIVNEARILRHLEKAAHIPQLLAYSEEQDCPYMVLEYLEGDLIETWRRTLPKFTQADLIAFLATVLEILRVLHQHQVVHQDVKPSNLIRSPAGAISLIDFGAAIGLNEPASEWRFGTPGYSPIEQQHGEVSCSNDIYALGMTAVELLTEVNPEEIARQSNGRIDWLRYPPAQYIEARLLKVLDRMVSLHPGARYPSATAILEDLKSKPQCKPAIPSKGLKQMVRSFPVKPSASIGIGIAVTALIWLSRASWKQSVSEAISQLSHWQPQPSVKLALIQDIQIPPISAMGLTAHDLITVGNGRMERWNLLSGKVEQSWASDSLSQIVVSQDYVAGETESGDLEVWLLSEGKRLQRFTPPEPVASIALSPSGHQLATLSATRTLRIFDAETGRLIRAPEPGITAIEYTPKDQIVCAIANDAIEVKTPDGQLQRVLSGHTEGVDHLTSSPDGNWLYSSDKHATIVWQLDRGELIRVLPLRESDMLTSGIIADQWGVQTQDGLRLWSRSGQWSRAIADFNTKARYSPDGNYIATVTNNHLKIWQVRGFNHAL